MAGAILNNHKKKNYHREDVSRRGLASPGYDEKYRSTTVSATASSGSLCRYHTVCSGNDAQSTVSCPKHLQRSQ